MTFIVDASVAVKWFVEEKRRDKALSFLDDDIERIAPDWVLQEVSHAVYKYWKNQDLTEVAAKEIIRDLPTYFTDLHLSTNLAQRTFDIALNLHHPTYDCLYLACAEAYMAPVVTDDETLFLVTRDTVFNNLVLRLDDIPT